MISINNRLANPQIQQTQQKIRCSNIASIKPKINLESLPLLAWESIVKTQGINILLPVRSISKTMYNNTLTIVINSFCKNKNFNNYKAFSTEAYFKFIKPKLDLLLSKLTKVIEEYIQNHSNQHNFQREFAKFLFYKIHNLEKIIPKSFATTNRMMLHDEQISSRDLGYINFFDLSYCGNFCVTVNNANNITIFEINSDFNLKKLVDFDSIVRKDDIKTIFFTPENNLCIISRGCTEQVSISKLSLYKRETQQPVLTKVAELTLTDSQFTEAIIKDNDTKLILLTQKPDCKHNTLEVWKLSQNQYIKQAVLDSSQIMISAPAGNGRVLETGHIEHIATNINADVLALSTGTRHNVCFFTLNAEELTFKREEINGYNEMTSDELLECCVSRNLQLNASGSFCVFINSNGLRITGFKRKDNSWLKIFAVINGNYHDIKLMPYGNNLLIHKDSLEHQNQDTIVLATKNYISRVKINFGYYPTFSWQAESSRGYLNIHPTGLAAFKFVPCGQYIESIVIRKSTISDTVRTNFKKFIRRKGF